MSPNLTLASNLALSTQFECGLVGGFVLKMWGFSEVEIWKVGCLVINSASSWLAQSTQNSFLLKNQPKIPTSIEIRNVMTSSKNNPTSKDPHKSHKLWRLDDRSILIKYMLWRHKKECTASISCLSDFLF